MNQLERLENYVCWKCGHDRSMHESDEYKCKENRCRCTSWEPECMRLGNTKLIHNIEGECCYCDFLRDLMTKQKEGRDER